MEEDPKKIAIIGGGNIGRGWAELFAANGLEVRLYDASRARLQAALTELWARLPPGRASYLKPASSLEACIHDVDYIQECVFEDVEVKREVFRRLDRAVFRSDAVLASSTSCLPPETFTADMDRRAQVIVVHPFNPPSRVPAVEVVPSPWTLPEILQSTCRLLRQVGRIPLVVHSTKFGFAFVRIQYALLNECWHLIEEGVLSVEDMDTVISQGLGPLYSCVGPFEALHLEHDGFAEFCRERGEFFSEVCGTLGSPGSLNMSGLAAEVIHADLCRKFPVERLEEWRQWRDSLLMKLGTLKKSWRQDLSS